MKEEIKCECGSIQFLVAEGCSWSAFIDEDDGKMYCSKPNSDIEAVNCRECGKELDYTDIEFEFD